MTNSDIPQKPGFRRTAEDFLGTDPSNATFDTGEKLGQILNDDAERRRIEREAEQQARYDHAAAQSKELSRISVENAVMIAGNPALKAVADHVTTEQNQPKESAPTEEVTSASSETDSTEKVMTIEEVRALIDQENNEASQYHGETGESVSLITDDPVSYARNHNIRIQ